MLNRLDASRVATIVGDWLAEQELGALSRLAVDGKVLRGSGRHDGKPLQLLSAVTHRLRLTLDQRRIARVADLAAVGDRPRARPGRLARPGSLCSRPG